MLCDECKKNDATVKYTEIVQNQTVKLNLCEECAKKKGVSLHAPLILGDLLAGLAETSLSDEEERGVVCSACGLSYGDFRRRGRLGCGICYETFDKALSALLESVHKNLRHTGKVPRRERRAVEVEESIRAIEARLQEAIAGEAFEEAARLRDEIRRLRDHEVRKDGE